MFSRVWSETVGLTSIIPCCARTSSWAFFQSISSNSLFLSLDQHPYSIYFCFLLLRAVNNTQQSQSKAIRSLSSSSNHRCDKQLVAWLDSRFTSMTVSSSSISAHRTFYNCVPNNVGWISIRFYYSFVFLFRCVQHCFIDGKQNTHIYFPNGKCWSNPEQYWCINQNDSQILDLLTISFDWIYREEIAFRLSNGSNLGLSAAITYQI